MQNELLVIEDAEVHLSILRKIAEQAGFNTTGVGTVEEAAAILRERTFDCITVDLQLGNRSGGELLQFLAELKCPVPVLIISALEDGALDENFRMATLLGLTVYPPFAKPVDLSALRRTLKQIATHTDLSNLRDSMKQIASQIDGQDRVEITGA
jgi:DNA-binding NtrC family response regulator